MIRPIIAAALAVSFTFVNPCSQESKVQKPKSSDPVYDVTVVYPKFISIPKKYHVPGTLEASEKNFVTANAAGEVEQVYVSVGDKVLKDDPLVSIASTQLMEKIDIKRARIKEYQARLSAAQAGLDETGGEDRPVSLEETQFLDDEPVDEAVVEKKFGDADNATKTPKTLKALVEVLESAIDVLQKESNVLDRSLLQLSHLSPVEGTVTELLASERNRVGERDKLVEVSQTNPMSVIFYLPEETASHADKNSSVKVLVTDAPDVSGEGTVYFISPNITTEVGKIEVRAHLA
ncbi:MAG TPA: efflux RND transporter periplasmic adaptor subunit, partial [bacterium]|nr:efflux RND transporter periplasmic adaptor subunit [bacterium]